MHKTLEASKLFPTIAWVLIVGFAAFTYFIITEVGAEMGELNENATRTEVELENFSDTIRR